MMKVDLKDCVPEITFECPAGVFSGVLHNVHAIEIEDTYGALSTMRFVFRADVPSMHDKTVLVGKNLGPNTSRLRAFLKRWLGPEFIDQYEKDGLELDTLIGIPADLEIQHVLNPGYKTPYRNLIGVYPLGSMKRNQSQRKIEA